MVREHPQIDQSNGNDWKRAAIALVMLVPPPSVAVYFSMFHEVTAGEAAGQAIYISGKIWIALLPLLWLVFIQRGRLSWSPPRMGGFGFGIGSGLLMSAVIILAWLLLGEMLIDRDAARDAAEQAGFATPARFLLLALYLCTLNAAMEEYVWRWFCFEQCERLVGAQRGAAAVMLSALFFTLHHVFVLAAQFSTVIVVLGSLGVFIGGCVWSYCYLRYRSIWPGFVSHAIVDVAILSIGWHLLFH